MTEGTVKASASSRGKPKTAPKRGKRGSAKPAAAKAAPKARLAGKRKEQETKPEAYQQETQQVQSPAYVVNPPPSQILGQIVWLAMHSPAHKHLFLTDLEWLVIPPLLLKQFRIFRKNGKSFAYVSWAFVSEAVEERITSDAVKLRPGDWKSGDQALIVDVVAPFGDEGEVVQELVKSTFADRSVKAVLFNRETGARETIESPGGGVQAASG